jgi:AIR synthase-related protein
MTETLNSVISAPDPDTLDGIVNLLRASNGIAHKSDINYVVQALAHEPGNEAKGGAWSAPLGDDCAAIPDADGGGGYLLLAIEGFINEFVEQEPWFAGYCGVMVNVSDIYAMGGRPLAIVDALWSRSGDAARPILDGMAAAAAIYQVPIVGGHSNRRSEREQLSVAITGRATKLLTSFDALPAQNLVVACDLRGHYQAQYNYWNASTDAPPQRLRADLELLPSLAEDGLCIAAKDISMAGVVGTALMLLECSGIGAEIDLDAILRPPDVPLAKWLATFPSYGFILCVADAELDAVLQRFTTRDLACSVIGRTNDSRQVYLQQKSTQQSELQRALLWDFASEALTGCGPSTQQSAQQNTPQIAPKTIQKTTPETKVSHA